MSIEDNITNRTLKHIPSTYIDSNPFAPTIDSRIADLNLSLFMNSSTFVPTQFFTIPNIFNPDITNISNIFKPNIINNFPPMFSFLGPISFPPNFNCGDSFSKTSTQKITRHTGNLQLDLANKAKSYVDKVNSDAEGNRLFSNGAKQAWCADFVTHVAKDIFGNKLPSSFGSSSVNGLRSWADHNDCYIKMPSSGKADFIAKNIHVGDIMIEKKGKSHTGIVTAVHPDGSFEVVEGNCGSKVSKRTYKATSKTLSGFISLDKFAT